MIFEAGAQNHAFFLPMPRFASCGFQSCVTAPGARGFSPLSVARLQPIIKGWKTRPGAGKELVPMAANGHAGAVRTREHRFRLSKGRTERREDGRHFSARLFSTSSCRQEGRPRRRTGEGVRRRAVSGTCLPALSLAALSHVPGLTTAGGRATDGLNGSAPTSGQRRR